MSPGKKTENIVQRRPAESAGIAGYIALLTTRALGVKDPDVIIAIAGLVAFAPTGVTWIVELVRRPR